jgi:glycosyltransferase involved in cell wall biosynthesis
MRIFVEDSRHPDRVTHPTGYAEIHRQLILGLHAAGEEVCFPPCHESLRACRILPEDVRGRLLALAQRSFSHDADTVYLQAAAPDGLAPRPGRFTAGLTMTERESIATYPTHLDWVGRCNALDLVVTPSAWNRQVFARHGIRNVEVVPLGVDASFFRPRPLAFLSMLNGYGYRGSRANWRDLVECFRQEFRGQEDVRLTIVSTEPRRPFRYEGVAEAVRRLPADLGEWLRARRGEGCPPVDVLEGGAWSQEEVRELYRQHDCYVSYSREGWGLPLLEAMACGLEVIACDYGAPRTFLEGSPARLFAPGRLSADNLKFEGGDRDALRRHLREVYEERRRARAWSARFSWAKTAAALASLLRDRHAAWRGAGAGRS